MSVSPAGRTQSNYEKMKRRMQAEFARYDQAAIAEQWELRREDGAIWGQFVGRTFRIDGETGAVTLFRGGREREADYNAAMTLFDILSRPRAEAAGTYSSAHSFSAVHSGVSSGGGLFGAYERRFDGLDGALAAACERLGGTPFGKGDVAMKIPVFRDLAVVLQFWDSDEEFGPALNLFCDDAILRFMHFETSMFLLFHVLERITEEIK